MWCCLQTAVSDHDGAHHTFNVSTMFDEVKPERSEMDTTPVDTNDASSRDETSPTKPSLDAKLLFGDGRLDRWLSRRRAFHNRPKLNTLDAWLSPGKTVSPVKKTMTPSPKRSPSIARTPSPVQSPVALKLSELPASPSTDIRKYFRRHIVPPSTSDSEHKPSKCDFGVESPPGTVDLVDDSLPYAGSEMNGGTADAVTPFHRETVSPLPEACVPSPAYERDSSSPCHTSESQSEPCPDWWATSRTKSSTRKGPFKRSLGLVHFLDEVCSCRWLMFHSRMLQCWESCRSAKTGKSRDSRDR